MNDRTVSTDVWNAFGDLLGSILTKGEDHQAERALLLRDFTTQVIEVYDPDAVSTFLRWKADPHLDTLLLLASKLDEGGVDELIRLAEQRVFEGAIDGDREIEGEVRQAARG